MGNQKKLADDMKLIDLKMRWKSEGNKENFVLFKAYSNMTEGQVARADIVVCFLREAIELSVKRVNTAHEVVAIVCREFQIKPPDRYTLYSNNRYLHPNESVLEFRETTARYIKQDATKVWFYLREKPSPKPITPITLPDLPSLDLPPPVQMSSPTLPAKQPKLPKGKEGNEEIEQMVEEYITIGSAQVVEGSHDQGTQQSPIEKSEPAKPIVLPPQLLDLPPPTLPVISPKKPEVLPKPTAVVSQPISPPVVTPAAPTKVEPIKKEPMKVEEPIKKDPIKKEPIKRNL